MSFKGSKGMFAQNVLKHKQCYNQEHIAPLTTDGNINIIELRLKDEVNHKVLIKRRNLCPPGRRQLYYYLLQLYS